MEFKGERVRFSFRGKSGVEHEIDLNDRRLARIVRQCRDLPGQELFQYMDGEGAVRAVTSSDVNDYIRDAAGESYTAKDFRTWYATIGALEALVHRPYANAREARAHVQAVLTEVSRRLGNTPSMCRKCYVHPGVLQAYLSGRLGAGGRPTGTGRERLLLLLGRAAHPGKDGARTPVRAEQTESVAPRRGSRSPASR